MIMKIFDNPRILDSYIYKFVHLFLSIFIILWMFSGISQLYLQLIPAYIKFGICIFWLLLSCLSLSFIKLEIKVMWPLALFLLYITVIYVFFNNDQITSTNIYQCVYLAIISSIALYYIKIADMKYCRLLLIAVFLDLIILIINTNYWLFTNGSLSRFLSTGNEIYNYYIPKDVPFIIATYPHAYAMVILCFYTFYLSLKENKKFIIAFIFLVITLIRMKFMTSLLFVILLIIFLLIKINYEKIRKILNLKRLLLLFIGIYLSSLLLCKLLLISNVLPEVLEIRLSEIFQLLCLSLDKNTDLYMRLDFYIASLRIFVESPFLGSMGNSLGIGCHSTFLDFFALYGLPTILLIVYYIQLYKAISYKSFIIFITFIYYLLLSLINNAFLSPIMLYLILIIPLLECFRKTRCKKSF